MNPKIDKVMEEYKKIFIDDDKCFFGGPNIANISVGWLTSKLQEVYEAGQKEERQFILNVLDGVDSADNEYGNHAGGTKAIRHALQTRIIV